MLPTTRLKPLSARTIKQTGKENKEREAFGENRGLLGMASKWEDLVQRSVAVMAVDSGFNGRGLGHK